ncbi:MAG: hypothetical protein AAB353_08185 [Candidatus Hydrogenedentota bacterium]
MLIPAGLGTFAGFLLGTISWFIARVWGKNLKVPMVPASIVISVLAIIGGRVVTAQHEHAALPRVLVDSGVLKALPTPSAELGDEAGAIQTFASQSKPLPDTVCEWNGRAIAVVENNGRIEILRPETGVLAATDISDFDYVREIYALPVGAGGSGNDYLAVFVDLRASSDRAMLLVYDSAGALVYQELLERDDFRGMRAGIGEDSKPVLIVKLPEIRAWTTR